MHLIDVGEALKTLFRVFRVEYLEEGFVSGLQSGFPKSCGFDLR